MIEQADVSMPEMKLVPPAVDVVFDKICTLLVPFNRHVIAVNRDTDIAGDMEVDSIAIFDVIMEIEDAYDVTFPMELVSEIATVGELVDAINTLKG